MNEALAAVEQLKEKGVQVAIVDGNLTDWDISGDDGAKIVTAIRGKAPSVKIVGLSSLGVIGADTQVDKMDIKNLNEIGRKL